MTTGPGDGGPLIGFRRDLRPEVVSGEATYLFSEHGVTALQGAQIEALAPLLDGTRDIPGLLREAPESVSPQQIGDLMEQLADAGLVALRPPTASPCDERAIAYWEAAGLDSGRAAARAATGRIHLAAVGRVDPRDAAAAFEAAGLAVVEDPGDRLPGDLTVALCDDYLAPGLAAVNAAELAAERAWLIARPYGRRVWIGPVFQPGGGCWSCLAHRLGGHRRAEAHVQQALGRTGPVPRPTASISPLGGFSTHLVALEAVKWLAGYRCPAQQSVWTLDTLTMESRHHQLRVRPQCPTCGDPQLVTEQQWRPVAPRSRLKTCYGGGGHRAQPPEQVLETYRHLISPITGVVKEIRRDPRGPAFLNSFLAGANPAANPNSPNSLAALRTDLRSNNGGKGISAVHGEVSALCEALERHSGFLHGDEPRIRGSLRELADRAVRPQDWLLFDPRQFDGRQEWNARHGGFQHVPDPFGEDDVVDWSPVWSLTERRHKLLPTAALYFGTPQPPGARFFHADSNGNAAGSSLEDAILQGFLELVERDAVALWWYNRTRQPAVDLTAFEDPWITELRGVHGDLGREVWALEVTSDFGIPTVVAFSRRFDKPAQDIVFGFGAHFDPRIALRRALTEVNQLLPAVVGARADGSGYQGGDEAARWWWRHATTGNQPYLAPDPALAPRRPTDYGYTPRRDLLDDLDAILDLTDRHGLEMLVVDQTRPDIGLPVVKVIVPGLRHFWSRFAPGRLFDVPVALGRLATPTHYQDLNPIPIFV
ncbi:bacteriocin biosynthesis cyclodehydratase domain-containing protein [Kitasatospora sp. GAS204A]|uniref:TOMM precursor leader peptide-binding protein n=1 Tax=unclassified Kitasatospora TaxID=2633591 RepID=UPI0024756123|nr:TOMM precursor leader peptide-binding protein [Kitasatospora sp. GAS204B]MDH6120737.1 bacteriocin biosynthesis cyclodehydratase domain-containing protein [Kitasatospora sp. GAS204B]